MATRFEARSWATLRFRLAGELLVSYESEGFTVGDQPIDDVAAIQRSFEEIADESSATAVKENSAAIEMLDRAIGCALGVLLPALNAWGRDGRAVIWRELGPKRADPSLMFVIVLTNVLNSALAARRLVLPGFDRQARTVFREMTEVGDLLLAIVADAEYLDRYLASPEDFDAARLHWDQQLKPWRVRERVRELARDVGYDGIWNDPDEIWKARWQLYAWLSKATHVDYAALAVEAVSSDAQGRHRVNIGGLAGARTTATIWRLTDYLNDTLVLLSLFLASRHGWAADEPEFRAALADVRDMALAYRAFARREPREDPA